MFNYCYDLPQKDDITKIQLHEYKTEVTIVCVWGNALRVLGGFYWKLYLELGRDHPGTQHNYSLYGEDVLAVFCMCNLSQQGKYEELCKNLLKLTLKRTVGKWSSLSSQLSHESTVQFLLMSS